MTSNVLLFRSRGDIRAADLVSAGPHRRAPRGRRPACGSPAATILVDESVLRTQNLAVFL